MKKFIYLAGPICGCDSGEANDWRTYVSDQLRDNIIGVSPLRREPMVGKVYPLSSDDPKFNTVRAIKAKNELDTRSCDLVLAYLPKHMNDKRPSYGTIVEMAWAYMLGKPVMLVTDDPYLKEHPLTSSISSWILEDLDQAVDTINETMGVYVNE